MILKMQKLTLIGFLADKEALLKDLMRKKCVQIEGPENIQDYESISAITVPGVAQTYELEQEQTKFTSAIRALSPYEEKGGLFRPVKNFRERLGKGNEPRRKADHEAQIHQKDLRICLPVGKVHRFHDRGKIPEYH